VEPHFLQGLVRGVYSVWISITLRKFRVRSNA